MKTINSLIIAAAILLSSAVTRAEAPPLRFHCTELWSVETDAGMVVEFTITGQGKWELFCGSTNNEYLAARGELTPNLRTYTFLLPSEADQLHPICFLRLLDVDGWPSPNGDIFNDSRH